MSKRKEPRTIMEVDLEEDVKPDVKPNIRFMCVVPPLFPEGRERKCGCNHEEECGYKKFLVRLEDESYANVISAMGEGLHKTVPETQTFFFLDNRKAGVGIWDIAFKGPGKVAINSKEAEHGFIIVYTTLIPGRYYLFVKMNGEHIQGSPFPIQSICPNTPPYEGEVPEVESAVSLEWTRRFPLIKKENSKNLNGDGVKCECPHKINCIGLNSKRSFIPELWKERPGSGIVFQAVTNESFEFTLNTKANRGDGKLIVDILGPYYSPINHTETDEGYKLEFFPREPGLYTVTPRLNGILFQGTPFQFHCTGPSIGSWYGPSPVTSYLTIDTIPKAVSDASKVQVYGARQTLFHGYKRIGLLISVKKAGRDDLYVCYTDPDGKKDETNYYYSPLKEVHSVQYEFKKRGTHEIIVQYGGVHVPRSPFAFYVT